MAAALLVQEIANLRDAVSRGRQRLKGEFAIWPLRNRLMMSRHLFEDPRPLEKVQAFVSSVETYRTWLRYDMGGPESNVDQDDATAAAIEYQRLLRSHSEALITMLQGPMSSVELLRATPTEYPPLPWRVPQPEESS